MRFRIIFFFLIFFAGVSSELYPQSQDQYAARDVQLKLKSDIFTKEPNFKKAQAFFLEKNWDSTLVYSMKQLSDLKGSTKMGDYCHYFRGFSFYLKGIPEEAKQEFSQISEDFEFMFIVNMIKGYIDLNNGDFKEALEYFLKLEDLQEDQLELLNIVNIQENIGVCYVHLKELKQSKKYLDKVLKYRIAQNDTLEVIETYGNLAGAYYEIIEDDVAIPYYREAYNLSAKLDTLNYEYEDRISKKTRTQLNRRIVARMNAAENMAVVEKNLKNFELAYQYNQEYNYWKDVLNEQFKNDNTWQIAEIEKEFAVKEKEKEVDVLEAENKVKEAEKKGLMYSSIILLALLGTGIYFYRSKVKSNAIITKQKEDLDDLNATKDKLFSIVSHDLRSSVNALKRSNSVLVQNLESKNYEQLDTVLNTNSSIVNGAYNLLDNLLHWAMLQTKQSYFEIESVRLFHIVEQVAFNYKPLMLDKQLHFENTISKSEKVFADQESLKIVLRNLLDNAIKFSEASGAIKIYTQNSTDAFCDLVIEDTGLGMTEATRLNLVEEKIKPSEKENKDIIGSGLGLQLCKSMIKKNRGKFFVESELGTGTKMIVSLSKIPPNG